MAQQLFIKDGWIVKETTAAPVNILITGERIAAVGPHVQPPPDAELVDASGLLVLPGLCDFGFFVGATHDNAAKTATLTDAVGLKLYMGCSTGSLLVDDFGGQYAHFKAYPPK